MSRTRVLLVDDHAILREGLRAALDDARNIEIVGEAATGREALAMVRELKPDVVILDIGMPDLNGIDATQTIVADHPKVRVIGLSAHTEHQIIIPMLEAGAAGYVLKGDSVSELVNAVNVVARGKKYLSPELVHTVVEGATHDGLSHQLTGFSILGRREREVLQLIAEGRSSKEIAREMHISTGTVETHRRNIMRKLDLHSVADLTRYAIREGLTEP